MKNLLSPPAERYRAVVFKRHEVYVVQFLEIRMATQAPSLPELPMAIHRMMKTEVKMAHRLGRVPFSTDHWPKADARYFEMWEKGEPLFDLPFEYETAAAASVPEQMDVRKVADAA